MMYIYTSIIYAVSTSVVYYRYFMGITKVFINVVYNINKYIGEIKLLKYYCCCYF